MIVFLMILVWVMQLDAYNPHHADKVLQLVKSKQPVNASRCDFRGLSDLFKNLNFSNAQFSGAMFDQISASPQMQSFLIQIPGQQSNLSSVNFSNASLVSTSFKNTILKNVNFSGADISYANFSGADLTGASLDLAKNSNLALFCGAIMPDGSKPTGSTWKSKSGKIIYLRCASS